MTVNTEQMEDIPDMSDEELHELHKDLISLIMSGYRATRVYDMLTVVNGEFARRN